MATIMMLSRCTIVPATKKHTATLFFFHGSGDTGENVKTWIDAILGKELKFPHIKIIYPTAPAQPYTPNNGMLSNVWFNRKNISNKVSEEEDSITSICHNVMKLIDEEHFNGIPYNRIIVAGFSMGGSLALYLAYKFNLSLGGCATISSFLNRNSMVYQHLENNKPTNLPPLLQFHGSSDILVPIQWGNETYTNLNKFVKNAAFVAVPTAKHEINKAEILHFEFWLNGILAE
ncbi:PREDICTED: lysophospholipase-like protein 1 [Polistes dominula]|uniref:palmitoyl-protein hydrolase n=1 Tax=Polistes dominula TaxID=743375 RepID=A0ABM1II39_POLDO|nr:PREDICTED: lysophospholipase-like protein 1 [Polistes dominula]